MNCASYNIIDEVYAKRRCIFLFEIVSKLLEIMCISFLQCKSRHVALYISKSHNNEVNYFVSKFKFIAKFNLFDIRLDCFYFSCCSCIYYARII